MNDNSDLRNETDDEAVQAVLDRVLSYQGGADVGTVRNELKGALSQIGATRSDEWLHDHALRISQADPAQG